jgi:hypothetical protein
MSGLGERIARWVRINPNRPTEERLMPVETIPS